MEEHQTRKTSCPFTNKTLQLAYEKQVEQPSNSSELNPVLMIKEDCGPSGVTETSVDLAVVE